MKTIGGWDFYLITNFAFESLNDGVGLPAAVNHVHRDVSRRRHRRRRHRGRHELETGGVDRRRFRRRRHRRVLPLDRRPSCVGRRRRDDCPAPNVALLSSCLKLNVNRR